MGSLFLFVWNKLFFFVLLGLCFRNYRNITLVALALVELYCTIDQCIQSVILTHCNVVACVVLRATLTNNDVAS